MKNQHYGTLNQFDSYNTPKLNLDFIKSGQDFNFTMDEPFKGIGLKYQIRENKIYYESSNSYLHKETIYNIAGYPERFIEEFRNEKVEKSINNTYGDIASLRGFLLNTKKEYGVVNNDIDDGEFTFTIKMPDEIKNPKIIKNLPDGYFVTENYEVVVKDTKENYIIVGKIKKEFI